MPTKQTPSEAVTVVIKAKDFGSRDALEHYVVENYGNTTEPKDAIIEGTAQELQALRLSHGDSVWGIVAKSTDYKPKIETPRVERGERHPSKLNGR